MQNFHKRDLESYEKDMNGIKVLLEDQIAHGRQLKTKKTQKGIKDLSVLV